LRIRWDHILPYWWDMMSFNYRRIAIICWIELILRTKDRLLSTFVWILIKKNLIFIHAQRCSCFRRSLINTINCFSHIKLVFFWGLFIIISIKVSQKQNLTSFLTILLKRQSNLFRLASAKSTCVNLRLTNYFIAYQILIKTYESDLLIHGYYRNRESFYPFWVNFFILLSWCF
jgi:hypothetical protein